MTTWENWVAVYIIFSCFSLTCCSYLGYPRIHFSGKYRADVNTRNNDECNYRMDKPFNPDENAIEWNINGTNEFEFVNTRITSVLYKDGQSSTTDPIVGRQIIGNLNQPMPKLSDITRDVSSHSSIFGMHVGVKWSEDYPSEKKDIAFHGKCSRMIVASFSWPRMKCYSKMHNNSELFQDDFKWTGQSTTTISDIDWSFLGNSLAATQLKEAAAGGNLQMRITLSYHTQNYPPFVAHKATLGDVLGVIGVSGESDTNNIPGERGMFFKNEPLNLQYDKMEGDLCYQQNLTNYKIWTNFAPFEFDKVNHEVRLDLSNSIPTNMSNMLRDIGTLRLGMLSEEDSCVLLLGNESAAGLPYASNHDLPITNAIYAVKVDPSLTERLTSNPLVVVQVLPARMGTDKICSYPRGSEDHGINIILQEYPYFVRPKEFYTILLDRNYNASGSQTVYATRYGEPAAGLKLNVVRSPLVGPPEEGAVPVNSAAVTDSNGLATFEFKLKEEIPNQRHYYSAPCADRFYPDDRKTLPIDSQVYLFYYCPEGDSNCERYNYVKTFVLGFSDTQYTKPYTWVKDVGPIFSQYSRLAPTMMKILDLSSYHNVTLPHNLNLLKRTFLLDIDHPSHMPTTRDLSPTKRAMIQEWLEHPLYNASSNDPPIEQSVICKPPPTHAAIRPDYFSPIRCHQKLAFNSYPHEYEPYFTNIIGDNTSFLTGEPIPGRPLAVGNNCSVDNVKVQLQTAIQLEWATLPVYLTSLYSIVDGCNTEIYNLTRSVVMQEMLHFTQSANTLIAMGGSPVIDSFDTTPKFPVTGLPGKVLQGLKITLEKLSLEHVYSVFMGIEIPAQTDIGGIPFKTDKGTIGEFYNEIKDCISTLNDSDFKQSKVERQVRWPWKPSKDQGDLHVVTDVKSANEGIDMIVAQGEGSGLLDPTQIEDNTLAHFFKFEEIVCQQHLEQIDSETYRYSGAKIGYQSDGVWPIYPNLMASSVPRNTNCYTESRAFHTVYRMLLSKLQEVFNGHPEDIFDAVQLMESLQLHAKKLRWTKFNPDDPTDDTTCGPIWDYYFPEDEK